MNSYKTSWEMYNHMTGEHKKIVNMSNEEKMKRCSNCRNLNDKTFSYAWCEPCSNCIGSIFHSTCIDEDYYEYVNWD